MAARWGVGEESLTTGNMEFFSTYALEEGGLSEDGDGLALDSPLDSGDSLESFHGGLDPSILCIFDDTVATGDAKSRMDEESEATLLTALTEILDNVDDENLSPFDTLPDSDLFSGRKGREQSPLRRLLSLAKSPPSREPVFGPKSASGKSEGAHQKARVLLHAMDAAPQRSDGEEEEEGGGGLAPSSESDAEDTLSPEAGVPLILDQEGEGISMSLSDLVKHMHPYCLTVCLEPGENEDGAQLLPEGGIVLEVVDQGEQGEPILAIAPGLTFPEALPSEDQAAGLGWATPEEEGSPEAGGGNEGGPYPPPVPEEGDEKACEERPKGEACEKCPTGRKKKRKSQEDQGGGEGVTLEGLSVAEQKGEGGPGAPIENPPDKRAQTLKQKKRVTFAPVLTSFLDAPADNGCQGDEPPILALSEQEEGASVTAMETGCNAASIHEGATATQHGDPKPKPISLQQYRILRQQKKLAPVERPEDHSTKWPTLPEPPTELPPIPCLLEPQHPQGFRRRTPQPDPKPAPDMVSAWQPVGPAAPPTPKALLVPPGSVASSSAPAGTSTRPARPTEVPQVQNPPRKPNLNPAPVVSGSAKAQPEPSTPNPEPQKPAAVRHRSPASVAQPLAPAAMEPVRCNGATPPRDASHLEGKREGNLQHEPLCPAGASLSGSTAPQSQVLPTKTLAPCAPTTQTTTQTPKPQASASPPKRGAPPCQPPTLPPALPASRGKPQRAAQKKLTPVLMPPTAKSSLRERTARDVTSDIGIEATDLTSLLEQFEETQANEEPRVPEVCGRAAAVGSSSAEQQPDRKSAERLRGPDLASTAGLTPPATPPHQIWKPLAPVALLGKTKQLEGLKPSPSKTIQIISPRPLPGNSKARSKCSTTTATATATAAPSQPAMPTAAKEPLAFMDHDYCLPREERHLQDTVTKSIPCASPSAAPHSVDPVTPGTTTAPGKFVSQPLDHRTLTGSVLLSPDTSPCRLEADTAPAIEKGHRSKSRSALPFTERSPSPRRRERGRARRRYRTQSPSSNSSSSRSTSRSCSESRSSSRSTSRSRSYSRSPPRKRFRSRRSESSSSSSSLSSSCSLSRSPLPRRRRSYARSRSGSWSRSRSRSPREQRHRWWRNSRSPSYRSRCRYDSRERFQSQDVKDRKEKAIEERRVVYVGRIRGGMTRKELKERFALYGEIEECTLHFREYGDNYGFVTYYNTKDAFTAIENGGKLRQSDELPFDLCFGGRRQFCKSSYADLDSSREYDPVPMKSKFDALDFDTLLRQAQKGLKR